MSAVIRLFLLNRQSSRLLLTGGISLRPQIVDPTHADLCKEDGGPCCSTRTMTTEAPVSETVIDARSLVGNSESTSSVPAPLSPRAVSGPSAVMIRQSRRPSTAVMALQQNLHRLLIQNKPKEAVKLFEDFVNEGFTEARSMNLPQGALPYSRRPLEYQWLQYLQALTRTGGSVAKQINSALQLMRQVGLQPKNAHYAILLDHIRRLGQSNRACELIDEMIKSGVRPSTLCYEKAIFTCLMAKDLDSTAVLLDSHFRSPNWQYSDSTVGRILYTKVISFCASLKRIENALIFMRQMADLQIRIPIHLSLDVICNAAEIDDSGVVDSLLRELQKSRSIIRFRNGHVCYVPLKIDEGVLLTVLNCAARTGHTFLADQAWGILKDCMKLPYSYELTSMQNAPLLNSPTEQQSKEAIQKEDNEEETVQKKENEAEEEAEEEALEEEDEEDHDHDEGFEVVKTADASLDDWQEHLSHLLHDSIPMVESYHAFIEAQAKGGSVEKAFEAVLELEENYPNNPQDLSPAQGLCMLADELAKDANTVDQAYFVLDEWHKNGRKVTVAMLDVIVAACSRMGDANRAFETFEAYPKLGITHRAESYNALMEVCATQRQVEVIMKLLQEMSSAGVKPNVDTYMQIIEGYINSGDTAGIAHALTITRREGLMPTFRVLDRAYQCADRYNDENAKTLIRKELLVAGYRFNLQLRNRGGGRGSRGRGGGRGRGGFTARGSPYPRGGDYQQTGQGQRTPIQTYVGAPPEYTSSNPASKSA